MKTRLALLPLLACLLATTLVAFAQEPEQKPAPKEERSGSVYRLDFTVYEKEDGKTLNTRSYTMLLEDRGRGQITSESRVPVQVGPAKGEFAYADVALEIKAFLQEQPAQVALQATLEIRDFASPAQPVEGAHPVNRKIYTQVNSAIKPGVATVVSSVDEAASRRRFQLEVTATKIK